MPGRVGPCARLVNLKTSITTSDEPWEGKSIHDRMHAANTRRITSAGIDCCVLANNHVLDWGYAGLLETLRTLERAGIKSVGAGRDAEQAAKPVPLEVGEGGRFLVLAFGSPTGGVPPEWATAPGTPGVNFQDILKRRSRGAGVGVERRDDGLLEVRWD